MTAPLDFGGDDAEEPPPEMGMAPLVDIVLLLISFYLFVMQSFRTHVDDRVVLPEVLNDRLTEIQPAELSVNLDEQGRLSLNGQPVDDETLRRLLLAEHAEATSQGRRLRVVIRADARLRYEALDEVLGACRDTGLDSIVLRTRRGRPP